MGVWLWPGKQPAVYTMEDNIKSATEKAGQVRSNMKSILIIFLEFRGVEHKEFVLTTQTDNG